MADYTRLKDLVNDEFTVEEVYGFNWKMWDNDAKKMLVSDSYEQGYRKIYGVKTDKGTMDVSAGQLGNMYEACSNKGQSDIIGRVFSVKSNGKDGIDIRYYINAKPLDRQPAPSWEAQREKVEAKKQDNDDWVPKDIPEQVDLSQIPF